MVIVVAVIVQVVLVVTFLVERYDKPNDDPVVVDHGIFKVEVSLRSVGKPDVFIERNLGADRDLGKVELACHNTSFTLGDYAVAG